MKIYIVVASDGVESPLAFSTRQRAQRHAARLNAKTMRRSGWKVREVVSAAPREQNEKE